jgi:hypothetical protein
MVGGSFSKNIMVQMSIDWYLDSNGIVVPGLI